MEKINKFKFRINKLYYSLFKEKFNKEINFDFPQNINRWDLIKEIIKIRNFSSYLEIGCDDDHSFNNITVNDKIGVDPYSGGNFRGTSNFFFSQNNRKFDCIFIDGLHEYDQVCNDLENSLNCLKENGIILLHDSLPANIHQQAVPRYKIIWNGDVWKSIVRYRIKNDCDIVTCKIDHGVSVVQKIINKKPLKNIDILDCKKLNFRDFYENHKEYMRIMSYKEVIDYISKSSN